MVHTFKSSKSRRKSRPARKTSRQVSQVKEVDTQEPLMLDQHMLDVDMLYSMVNALQSSNSTRTRIGFVTTCPPSIRPPLPWCSSAPGVQERARDEFIRHVVPGVPVTPLDSNLHETGAKVKELSRWEFMGLP